MTEKLRGLPLYTLKELAQLLEVTERTLHTYIKDGKIKGVKIGGKWKVTEENLQRFISGGSNN